MLWGDLYIYYVDCKIKLQLTYFVTFYDAYFLYVDQYF